MTYWQLFLLFLKVNLFSTSGPASIGLLYGETVEKGQVSREDFSEVVGYANALPGAAALQIALFLGYKIKGVKGAVLAIVASTLPAMGLLYFLIFILEKVENLSHLESLVEGMRPAVALVLLDTAFKLVKRDKKDFPFFFIFLASLSLILMGFSPVLVVFGAGLCGLYFY